MGSGSLKDEILTTTTILNLKVLRFTGSCEPTKIEELILNLAGTGNAEKSKSDEAQDKIQECNSTK
jgi:hypothetical protein